MTLDKLLSAAKDLGSMDRVEGAAEMLHFVQHDTVVVAQPRTRYLR
jgi:hypothetical protein